uniref:Homeobox domain-containing protein n=1 Tax=Monodelphis domestica TaxID=13616 RepID=F7BHJ2_MONDO
MLSNLYHWFWKDENWLPAGYTWTDIEDGQYGYMDQRWDGGRVDTASGSWISDYSSLPASFHRTVGVFLSRVMGVRDHLRLKPDPNPILESFFQTQSQNPKEAQLSHLASQCGLSVRQTQHWFRRRRNQAQPNLTKKFCESSWRLFFYFSSSFGIFLAIYNDTMEQIIHHFIVIILLFISYCGNLLSFGGVTLLLHDVTDILLEASKMFLYAQWKHACEILFYIFAVMFIVNRLILFPTKIIYVFFYHFTWKPFFAYIFTFVLLIILQGLHVFWTYLVLQRIYLRIIYKEVCTKMTLVLASDPSILASQGHVNSKSNPREIGLAPPEATEIENKPCSTPHSYL